VGRRSSARVAALRGDLEYFNVTSLALLGCGERGQFRHSQQVSAQPKIEFDLWPWSNTEFYAQGGFSFHSNDGRGRNANGSTRFGRTILTRYAQLENSRPDPNQRRGKLACAPRPPRILQSTLALWYLRSAV